MASRSKMEIHMDILRAVAEGRHKRTHIMYGANLDWYKLMGHVDSLVKQNLLKKTGDDDDSTDYALTQRGKEVLEYYKRFENKLYQKEELLPYKVYSQNRPESWDEN